MLKRINLIQRIGCYQNARAANKQFEQLTFIYGDNSFGKSTLCDVFQSLSSQDSSFITKRKSIPNEGNLAQRVELNMLLLNATTERSIIYSNENWTPSLGDIKIYVFDTDFIHRNVFTGLSIERRNQENITQFVLGEDSVTTAREIAENKSTLRTLNRDINNLLESNFQDIEDLQTFVALQVQQTEDEVFNSIATNERNVLQKRETIANLDTIINKSHPEAISITLNFESLVERLNHCLSENYTRVHENASELVLEHIRANCNPESQSESWLRQGLNQIINEKWGV